MMPEVQRDNNGGGRGNKRKKRKYSFGGDNWGLEEQGNNPASNHKRCFVHPGTEDLGLLAATKQSTLPQPIPANPHTCN